MAAYCNYESKPFIKWGLHFVLQVATSVDFAEIFNLIVSHDRRMCYLTQYICELALLQAEMGQYSPAEVAASSVLLSRLLVKMGKHFIAISSGNALKFH